MKNLIKLSLSSLALAIAFASPATAAPDKVKICHKSRVILVSESAVASHRENHRRTAKDKRDKVLGPNNTKEVGEPCRLLKQ